MINPLERACGRLEADEAISFFLSYVTRIACATEMPLFQTLPHALAEN